jgi:CRP-like cAMP-binding protein
VEKSTVILIPGEEMQQLLAENAEVSLGVTKLVGLRRQRIERRLKYLLFRSSRERLVHLLLELAEQYGQAVPGGVQLRIKLSHQDLANIIGSTRETVTVVLGELQAEGRLQLGRRKIVLSDLVRLADSVGAAVPRLTEA